MESVRSFIILSMISCHGVCMRTNNSNISTNHISTSNQSSTLQPTVATTSYQNVPTTSSDISNQSSVLRPNVTTISSQNVSTTSIYSSKQSSLLLPNVTTTSPRNVSTTSLDTSNQSATLSPTVTTASSQKNVSAISIDSSNHSATVTWTVTTTSHQNVVTTSIDTSNQSATSPSTDSTTNYQNVFTTSFDTSNKSSPFLPNFTTTSPQNESTNSTDTSTQSTTFWRFFTQTTPQNISSTSIGSTNLSTPFPPIITTESLQNVPTTSSNTSNQSATSPSTDSTTIDQNVFTTSSDTLNKSSPFLPNFKTTSPQNESTNSTDTSTQSTTFLRSITKTTPQNVSSISIGSPNQSTPFPPNITTASLQIVSTTSSDTSNQSATVSWTVTETSPKNVSTTSSDTSNISATLPMTVAKTNSHTVNTFTTNTVNKPTSMSTQTSSSDHKVTSTSTHTSKKTILSSSTDAKRTHQHPSTPGKSSIKLSTIGPIVATSQPIWKSSGSPISTKPTISISKVTQMSSTKTPNKAATVEVEIVIYLTTKTKVSNFTDSLPERKTIHEHLKEQYNDVPGFIGIEIYIFRLVPNEIGSQARKRRQTELKIEVAFKVIAAPFKTLTSDKLNDAGRKTFEAIRIQTSVFIKTPSINHLTIVDPVHILIRLETEITKINSPENKSKLLCGGLGYSFNQINNTCLSRCVGFTCQNNGLCILDINGTPVCRCTEDDKYVFSGKFCSTRVEKLKLASEYIIAAACGSGGIIIIVTILVCLVCRSRNHKERQEKDYYITEHDTLSNKHPAGLFGRQRTPSNVYLSMRDSAYNVDDRRYTGIEDAKRNRGNTYIYSPSAKPSRKPGMDDQSEHSYNNKSFCSEEFAIKRPHLRTKWDFFHSDYSRSKIQRPDYM